MQTSVIRKIIKDQHITFSLLLAVFAMLLYLAAVVDVQLNFNNLAKICSSWNILQMQKNQVHSQKICQIVVCKCQKQPSGIDRLSYKE